MGTIFELLYEIPDPLYVITSLSNSFDPVGKIPDPVYIVSDPAYNIYDPKYSIPDFWHRV